MIECERERISEAMLDERLAIRASDGWRLISAVQHPFATEGEAPLWMLFWERAT